jgi:hypothetical protein
MELRDEEGNLQAVFHPPDILEIKCRSRLCGAQPGVIVLHRWKLPEGTLETKRYKDPARAGREEASASDHSSTTVRSA